MLNAALVKPLVSKEREDRLVMELIVAGLPVFLTRCEKRGPASSIATLKVADLALRPSSKDFPSPLWYRENSRGHITLQLEGFGERGDPGH